MEFANIEVNSFFIEYLPILFFIIIPVVIVALALGLSFVLAPNNYNKNKLSSYECGFDSMGTAENQIDIKFHLTAVLFIIFDVEILFIYPWIMSFYTISNLGFFIMMGFIFLLAIGFIYEWKKGAMSWK